VPSLIRPAQDHGTVEDVGTRRPDRLEDIVYARFQTTHTAPPADLSGRVEEMLDLISAHPGFAGAWVLPPIAAGGAGLLTLWQTRDDAERASDRTAAVRGPRPVPLHNDAVYEVVAEMAGTGAPADPAFAQLAYFDGPRTDEWAAAFLRAGKERLWPAVRDIPGTVRFLTLAGEANAQLQVGLVTSIEAIEATGRAIISTELLPWEDPAMLTGPDRVDLHRVLAFRVPAPTHR
jgi:hypothetical protein